MVKKGEINFSNFKVEPDLIGLRTKQILEILIPNENLSLDDSLLPDEERKELLHGIISKYVQENRQIPVLIAAAACKLPLSGKGLDGAEFLFVDMLRNLHHSIQAVYEPGLKFRVRLEDGATIVLFPRYGLDSMLRSYIKEFKTLTEAMNANHFIEVVCETDAMGMMPYLRSVLEKTEIFKKYLVASAVIDKDDIPEDCISAVGIDGQDPIKVRDETLAQLQSYGWGAPITKDARHHWFGRYAQHFPADSASSHFAGMSKYFANVLVRKELKGYGVDKTWNHGYVEIGLQTPAPDSPEPLNKLYYRTAPKDVVSTKLPFWRLVGVTRQSKKDGSFFMSAMPYNRLRKKIGDNVCYKIPGSEFSISFFDVEVNEDGDDKAATPRSSIES